MEAEDDKLDEIPELSELSPEKFADFEAKLT